MMRSIAILLLLAAGCLVAKPKIEKLATGFRFTEGPALAPDGTVYFTDLPTRRTYRRLHDGKVLLFREQNDQANGLAFDNEGNLIICEQDTRRLTKLNAEGDLVVLTDSFEGKKFNSPNDLFLSQNGGIYFTDPRYMNRETMELDHESVYYLDPSGVVSLEADDLVRPNGLVGTPCGKWLYVADHGGRKTYRYGLEEDGSLSIRTLFANQGSDGMAIDSEGNLYLTDEGVDVYSSKGEHLETITLPERPANVAILSESPLVLFVTARTSVYRVTFE